MVSKKINLKQAFENVKKAAQIAQKAQSDFSHALANSKYEEIEIPDEIVDVVDYGTADMNYEEFIKKMDEALKKDRENNK